MSICTAKPPPMTSQPDPPSKPVAKLRPSEEPLARLVSERAAQIRARQAAEAHAKPDS